ncbi:MAG: hypothetical protein CVU69_06635 [Deltaproteobacteria bacterium HGW-Deltaproteobacteria-4]|nr:MAG: hypothetical protein CVU69_06635 [Deltaproteobacteria bacterium HGW-Deltaproteobacteria-4]
MSRVKFLGGTKQVPGVAPPTTPYFFSLPERSRQEKAPHHLARCAGSLRPADVWRADKNSLRSDICPPLSPNVHRAPATAKGGNTKLEITKIMVGAALVAARFDRKLPSLLKEGGMGVVGLKEWRSRGRGMVNALTCFG